MRVLHIIGSLDVGGAEMSTLYLVSRGRRPSVDSAVLGMHRGGALAERFYRAGSAVFSPPSLRSRIRSALPVPILDALYRVQNKRYRQQYERPFRSIRMPYGDHARERYVKNAIRSFKPELVHVHQASCMEALRWARECGVQQTVYTHHSMTGTIYTQEDIRTMNALIQHSDWITFVSDPQSSDFLRLIRYPATQTTVIPPRSSFDGRPAMSATMGRPLTIGMMSNLSPMKNPLLLIGALLLLGNDVSSVRVVIAGGDPRWKAVVEQEAKRSGLTNVVRFLGILNTDEAVAKFYSSLDLFISTSLEESYNISLVDAMQCGIAVLSSDVESARALINHGINGLLFENDGVEDLVTAIRYCMKNRERIRNMGITASQEINAQRIRQDYAEAHLDLYAQLLGDPSRLRSNGGPDS